jgi:hypothetical protein
VKFTRDWQTFTRSTHFKIGNSFEFHRIIGNFTHGMEGAKNGFSYPDMRTRIWNRINRAMTVFEVVVIVTCVVILGAVFLSLYIDQNPRHSRAPRIQCVSNLKQIDLAFRIWEGENNNQYPMAVSITNGGALEMMETGNLTACLQCASNEMSTPKIFVCPADPDRTCATNWNELNSLHVSYFISADASEDHPEMVLDGDDNFLISGEPAKSSLLEFSSNSPVTWSEKRHRYCGNLGFTDGSVQEISQGGLQQVIQTGLATNRIVIP